MEIVYKRLDEIRPYPNNPRQNAKAVAGVVESIKNFGFRVPIVIDKEGTIVCGHTRYKAAHRLKMDKVPTVCPDLTEEQTIAYRIIDNKISEFSRWDDEMLLEEMSDLADSFKMDVFGFKPQSLEEMNEGIVGDDESPTELPAVRLQVEIPPNSVIEQGKEYDKIYKYYKNLGIVSGDGRDDDLIGNGMKSMAEKMGRDLTGTSVFNPVLCHCMYKWFNRDGGIIFDPFAGGYSRGIIATHLGYEYIGIDLREEQVEVDRAKAEELELSPTYICDDSLNADAYIDDETADMVMTCPPYYDLEVYSDDERDLSAMSPDDFLDTYKRILEIAYRKLKNNSFFCIVVSEVRDKKGFYRRFVLDTIDWCKSLGMSFWDEIILINTPGSKAISSRRPFGVNRKVSSIHQNCLVFYKGNPQEMANNWGEEAI